VKASNASVISSTAYHNAHKPVFENVYISVNPATENFRGVSTNCSAKFNNVVVEYAFDGTPVAEEGVGAFVSSKSTVEGANNYLISKVPIEWVKGEGTELVEKLFEGVVTRFENLEAMKNADVDLSSFDSNYWVVKDKMVLWKNELSVKVSKNNVPVDGKVFLDNTTDKLSFDFNNRFGSVDGQIKITSSSNNVIIEGNTVSLKNEIASIEENAEYVLTLEITSGEYSGYKINVKIFAEKAITRDTNKRAYSIVDGTLDLTGLGFTLSDVSSVEIKDTKLDVTAGKLPAMEMEVYGANKLKLTITGITDPIILNKADTDQDFEALSMRLSLTNGDICDLTKVNVYNKVLKNASDITWLFGAENANKHLDGYYVLGGNIDATTAEVSGALRYNSDTDTATNGVQPACFRGIFDGMGYVISNLNISGKKLGNGNIQPGSLFGQIRTNKIDKSSGTNYYPSVATIRNVAFTNVTATNAAIISTAMYDDYNKYKPIVSNVYVSVNSNTTNFVGMFGYNGNVKVNNCIIDCPLEEKIDTSHCSFTTSKSLVSGSANNYVISKTFIGHVTDGSSLVERTDISDIVKRYNDLAGFKSAASSLDFSSFNYCWTITDGIPVWTKLN